MDINSITLVGRLTDDPIALDRDGMDMCKFNIATSGYKKKGAEKPEVLFIEIVTFGNMASMMSKWLKKGIQVCVNGSLNQNQWKDHNGNKRSNYNIKANNIQILTPKEKNEDNGDVWGEDTKHYRNNQNSNTNNRKQDNYNANQKNDDEPPDDYYDSFLSDWHN